MKNVEKHELTFTIVPVKKITVIICIASFLILLVPHAATAQQPTGLEQLVQEFFIGETVYPQEKNEVQVTLKPSYHNQKEGTKFTSIPLQLEYGITNRFQVQLGLPYVFQNSAGTRASGFDNVEAGFLYNILKGNKPFALSVALDAALPTARKAKEINETGDGEVTWEPSVIVARQLGRIQVHASLVAELSKAEPVLTYNLAAVIPMHKWRAVLELSQERGDDKIFCVAPGLVWTGLDDFEFGVGVSKSRQAWGVSVMAIYEFSLTGGIKLQRK